MKFYLFLCVVIVGVIFSAYYVGMRVAGTQCVAERQADAVQQQAKIIKIQRIVNDQVSNTAAGDVRRVLREKYTIAE